MIRRLMQGTLVLGMFTLASGCIVAEPREGYYDHDHHRYYSGHVWHECGERNDFCR